MAQFRMQSMLVGCLLGLATLAQPAFAGRNIEVDFAPASGLPADSNYAFDGQYWFANGPLTVAINSTFIPLNFGSGAPSSRTATLDPLGRVTFAGSNDFIAPMLLPNGSIPYRIDTLFGPTSRFVVSDGYLDPAVLVGSPDFLGNYDFNNALPAFRFLWQDVCTPTSPCDGSGNGHVNFEATLVRLANDAFLLQFNYQSTNAGIPAGATAGFSLGNTTRPFNVPTGSIGPDFCFNHGVVSDFTTIAACTGSVAAVPEPMTTLLVGLGLAFIAAVEMRRRRPAPKRART